MKYILSILLFVIFFSANAQTDTATISLQVNSKQYFVRIGYNTNQVDSAIRVRKFDTSYSSSRGVEIRYKDDIIKYYTGTAIVYISDNDKLKRYGNPVKVYLPIDYPDNDKFTNYLRRKLFK